MCGQALASLAPPSPPAGTPRGASHQGPRGGLREVEVLCDADLAHESVIPASPCPDVPLHPPRDESRGRLSRPVPLATASLRRLSLDRVPRVPPTHVLRGVIWLRSFSSLSFLLPPCGRNRA